MKGSLRRHLKLHGKGKPYQRNQYENDLSEKGKTEKYNRSHIQCDIDKIMPIELIVFIKKYY